MRAVEAAKRVDIDTVVTDMNPVRRHMLIVDDMPPDGFAVHDNCVRKAIRELKQTAEQP